jgi:hypothetical protein
MEKISNFETVRTLLKSHLSVMIQNPQQTRFNVKGDKIIVKTDHAQYSLSWEEFEDLFMNSIFYSVDYKENNEVEIHKDDEYYAWKHK